ncbi:hypothetical protein [Pectobacterium aroidearum]|uniref:hypothetical protein n=1 Tax=Pectobacterium aroidearum TaxID=1201031 RepID=UPI0032EDE918
MDIIDGIRFENSHSSETVIFNFYTWVEVIKAIIVKYANKTEREAEHLVSMSPILCNPVDNYMSVVMRSHESEYHWAMLITYGEGYWENGVNLNEPDGYFDWENEYRKKNNLAEECFIFID